MAYSTSKIKQFVNFAGARYFGRLQNTEITKLILAGLLTDAVDKGDVSDSAATDKAKEILTKEPENLNGPSLLEMISQADFTKEERIQAADAAIEEMNQYGQYMSVDNTPSCIMEIVYNILGIKNGDEFYDIGSGCGKALADITSYAEFKGNVDFKTIGIELNEDLATISEMSLALHNADCKIENADVFAEGTVKRYSKGYLYPPVGARYNDEFVAKISDEFNGVINTRSSSEWYFVLKAAKRLTDNGQLAVFLPEGSLFRSRDNEIRKYLMNKNLLQGVIALPPHVSKSIPSRMYLLIIGHSDGSFKMIDATDAILKNNGRETVPDTDEIVQRYFSPDAVKYSYQDAAEKEYCLNLSAYAAQKIARFIDCPEKISNVADVIVGSQYTLSHFKKDPPEGKTDYQILISSDIENGIIDYDSLLYIKPDEKLDKFELHEGDVVVTTKSTVVKTAVISDLPSRHIIVTGGMIIVRPQPDKLDPTYLKMFLDSTIGKKILTSVQKGSIIITISTSAFKNIDVACPPIEKQRSLANRYNTMIGMYSALQTQLNTLKTQIITLYDDSLGEN